MSGHTIKKLHTLVGKGSTGDPHSMQLNYNQTNNSNNNNNIFYSSQREIKAVVRSHNEEHISIILSHKAHAHTHSCYKQYTVTTIYCDIMSCLQEWCTSRTPAQMDRVRRSVLPLLCFPVLCPGRSCNRPSAVWKTSTLSCTEWHRTTGFWKRLWEGRFAVIVTDARDAFHGVPCQTEYI